LAAFAPGAVSGEVEMRLKGLGGPLCGLRFRADLKTADRDFDCWRAWRFGWLYRLAGLLARCRRALRATPRLVRSGRNRTPVCGRFTIVNRGSLPRRPGLG
jgi:hypothetical protein